MGLGDFEGVPLCEPLHLPLILIGVDAAGRPQKRAARTEKRQGVCCDLPLHVNKLLASCRILSVAGFDAACQNA